MRRTVVFLVLALAGCAPGDFVRAPPEDRFYYPISVAFARPAGGEGVLYVASSNFDKRYSGGSLLAVDLTSVGVPVLGAPVPPTGPPELDALLIGGEAALEIATFAGQMRAWPLPAGGVRLFVPSRAEENRLQIVDAQGTQLICVPDPDNRNCITHSMDLVSLESKADGRPQAPQPFGVGISTSGQVVVTHQQPAKLASSTEVGTFYVVALPADPPPTLTVSAFLPVDFCVNGICAGGTESVAVGQRYAYATGKIGRTNGTQNLPGNLLRWVDLTGTGRVGNSGIESIVQVYEGRGVALRTDESRVYVVGRGQDSLTSSGVSLLLAVDISAPLSDSPTFRLAQSVTLPERCNEVLLLPRAGRGDLVFVSCEDAGAVVVYDDDQGRLVANAQVGQTPFGLAIDARGGAARLFVTGFTDGHVWIVDMPNVNLPEEFRVVASLGLAQTCLVRTDDPACKVQQP